MHEQDHRNRAEGGHRVSAAAGLCWALWASHLEVYNSVQCLSYTLTAEHFYWAAFVLFLSQIINPFNRMSLILADATSDKVELEES